MYNAVSTCCYGNTQDEDKIGEQYKVKEQELKDREKLLSLDDQSGWGPNSLFAYLTNSENQSSSYSSIKNC